MSGIHEVYLALSLIFAAFIGYMFFYNIRLKTQQRSMQLKGRPPVSKEEGIAIATDSTEHSGTPSSMS
jgi:hypothetical protein